MISFLGRRKDRAICLESWGRDQSHLVSGSQYGLVTRDSNRSYLGGRGRRTEEREASVVDYTVSSSETPAQLLPGTCGALGFSTSQTREMVLRVIKCGER